MKMNPKRKSKTLPDQALTPQQIMDRYLKGLPVNAIQRDRVYMDGDGDTDYEALSRMDFDEKAEVAARLRERAAQIEEQLKAQDERTKELAREELEDLADAAYERAANKKTGIDNLDNTMPVDTKVNTK